MKRFAPWLVQRKAPAIRVRNVTIGIRGTDLRGRSTDERDLACLIDGAIGVSARARRYNSAPPLPHAACPTSSQA